MTDIRGVLDHGAARPRKPVDVDLVLSRSRQLGRRRGIAAVVAVAVLVPAAVVGASVARRDREPSAPVIPAHIARTVVAGPGNEVAVPAESSVTAVVLNDEARVYVVRHDDGEVTVVEAISTHRPFGLQKQIGWCPSAGGFEDVQHGSRWDDRGRHLFGPAPRDLATYDVVVGGDQARIGERRNAESRSQGSTRGNVWCNGDAQGDASMESMLFADFPTPAADLVPFDEFARGRAPRAGVVAVDAFVELGGYADTHGSGIAVCGSVTASPAGVPDACSGGPHFLLRAAPGYTGSRERVLIGRVRVLLRLPGQPHPDTMLTTDNLVRLPDPATFVPGSAAGTGAHTFGFPKSVTVDADGGVLTFDEAEFLSGEDANAAAREAGAIGPSDTVPNDYYIRNADTVTTTYRVDGRTEFLILNADLGLAPTSLEEFARKVNGETERSPAPGTRIAHVFRNVDGTVARLVEQYVP